MAEDAPNMESEISGTSPIETKFSHENLTIGETTSRFLNWITYPKNFYKYNLDDTYVNIMRVLKLREEGTLV